MRIWGLYLAMMVIGVCVFGTPATLWAALNPAISTQENRDFTRVTFGWPQNVRFQVNPYKGAVVLKFSQAADINLNAIRTGLGSRLTSIALSPDKTSLTLKFDQPYRVRHFVSGNANGIDILGTTPLNAPIAPAPKAAPVSASQPSPVAATAPALPKTAPAALTPQSVKVAAVEAVGGTVSATPAEKAPVAVTTATQSATAQPVAAKAAAPTPVAVAQVPTGSAVAVAAATPSPPTQPVVSLPEATSPSESVVSATPNPVPAPVAPPATPAAAAEAASAPVAETAAATTPTTQITPAEAAATANPDPFAAPAQPTPAAPEPTASPEPLSAPDATPQAPTAEALSAAKAALIEPDTQTSDSAPVATQPATPAEIENLIVTSKSLPTGTEINFPWVARTAAAVFSRGSDIWIVFDAPSKINLKLLEGIMPAAVTKIEPMDVAGHTVLRLQTDGSVFPKVAQPANSQRWVVGLSNYHQIPPRPAAMTFTTNATIASVFMPVLEHTEPFILTDPVVGDEIIITPFYTSGEGVYPARKLVEADILESAQGLAVIKKADLTEVRSIRNGLRIANRNGMSLSSNLPAIASDELEALQSQYTIWFPYDKWKIEPDKFTSTRQELEQKMIGATSVRANSLRLKLAQMYLAEGLGFETIALLDIIKADDPVFFTERKLAAMHGAANFISDRFNEAAADFASEELDDTLESKLWNEALSILKTDRPRFDYLEYFKNYIQHYPPALRDKLAVLAADNYINRKSFNKALKTFDTLSESGISPRLMPYLDFLLGKISSESKNYDAAISLWEPLSKNDTDNFIRARAEFALVSMLYTQGRITIDEALDRLDHLRIVWRGDSLEQSLLSYLGQLYIDHGDYLEGLRAWRELLTNFPDSPLASSITREMAKTFNKLFAEGEADKLKPLQALSIFYEFRELTPVGAAGDTMIQGLADRLANVDLLDRAAALLEHQIKFRQERAVRSKLGAQLGLVYLLNREPKKALKALELTNYGKNPEPLKLKRLQLTAMALSEIGKPQRAIEMLSPDTSKDADMLRLNIFWKMRDWKEVIRVAETLLSDRDDLTRPLTPQENDYALQLAIAYMFESDTTQLQYLRDYFGPLIAKGPSKDIFDFVTDASGPIDYEKMNDVTKQISRIETFMQTYRDRVNERGLNAAIN